MTIGDEITALDEVAAALRAIAAGDAGCDGDVLSVLADQVAAAADRAQDVADLRTAVAVLEARLAAASSAARCAGTSPARASA